MGGRGLREPAVLLAMHRVAIKRQRLPRRCRWRVGHAVLLMKAETRVMTGVIVAAVIVMIIIVVDVDVDVVVVGPGFVAVMVVQHAINNPALLAIRAGMGGVCAGVGDVADCQGRAHGACPWLCGGDCCGCRGCKR